MFANGKKNVGQWFPKPKMTSLKVSFRLQPKDIQFPVREEQWCDVL